MGELKGHQLQPREIAALAYDAGWQDAQVLLVAVCVCLAESQGYDHALNVNPDGSRDRGIWQLNSIHAGITDEIAYDPVRATEEAFKLYVARGSDFDAWAAFNSRVYLHDSYLGRAAVGVANYLGEVALGWETEPGYVHRFETPIADFRFRLSAVLSATIAALRVLRAKSPTPAARKQAADEIALALLQAKMTYPHTT